MARKVARKSLVHPLDLAHYKREAEKEFPMDKPDIALNKYVRLHKKEGVFFWDDDGNSTHRDYFLWGPELLLNHLPRSWEVKDVFGPLGRIFSIPKTQITLKKDIDRPRPFAYEVAVRHPSYKDWNLPVDHPRHILKFPKEILSLIFQHTLTVDEPNMVKPETITSNWKAEARVVGYQTERGRGSHNVITYHDFIDSDSHDVRRRNDRRYIGMIPRRDKEGLYTEMFHISRPNIDATFLRTCKLFYNIGVDILYGNNEFFFPMVNAYCRNSPPTCLPDHTIHKPDAAKDNFTTEAYLLPAFQAIQDSIPWVQLEGWVYYDHFLRFLHTIGPKNAALIKAVRFEGIVKIHRMCYHKVCGKEQCDEDLVESLKFYLSFIRRFCPNLEKLSVNAREDEKYLSGIQEGYFLPVQPGEGPANRQEAFTPLLEKIKSLGSIKKLEILGEDDEDDGMEFAAETVEWIKERAANKRREEREAYAKEQEPKKDSKVLAGVDVLSEGIKGVNMK